MITRYGYDVFFTVTILCVAAIILALWLVEPKFIRYGIGIIKEQINTMTGFKCVFAYFFSFPVRKIPF